MRLAIALILATVALWNLGNIPHSRVVKALNSTVASEHAGNFIDFVQAGNELWAITEDSSLVLFNLENKRKSKIHFGKPLKIRAIAKDRHDQIVIADSKNRVGKYEAGDWKFSEKFNSRINAIFFTKQNDQFLLTDNGILNVKEGTSYFPDSSQNNQLRMPYAFRAKSTTFLDSRDNIWIGYNHGEWGGDIYIFSTSEKRYITPSLNNFDISLNPIFAFTEGPAGVYVSGGLSHLGMTSGFIGQFQNFSAKVLYDSEYDEWFKDSAKKEGYYIGPVAYNQHDNSLYIYTQRGFYKCKANADIAKVETWEVVVKPELLWTFGQRNATGYSMNVRKILTTGPGAFIFLTEQDGIGYFSGKELTMLK